MKKTPVPLSELIESVSVELRTIRANKPAKGEEVLALTSCEIELSVAATTEGSAGIKFYVIELGGKGSATASHKIKLTFAAAGEKIICDSAFDRSLASGQGLKNPVDSNFLREENSPIALPVRRCVMYRPPPLRGQPVLADKKVLLIDRNQMFRVPGRATGLPLANMA